jgi:hypothetical protein
LWAVFGTPARALGVLALLAWLFVYPAIALADAARRGDRATARRAASGIGAAVIGRIIAALRTGGRPLDAAAHPASIATLCWLIGSSLIGRRGGTLTWRGRPLLPDTGVTSSQEPKEQ